MFISKWKEVLLSLGRGGDWKLVTELKLLPLSMASTVVFKDLSMSKVERGRVLRGKFTVISEVLESHYSS